MKANQQMFPATQPNETLSRMRQSFVTPRSGWRAEQATKPRALLGSLFLACLMAAAVPASAQVKIATLNLKRVFDSYWKTKEANTRLHAHAADLDKQKQDMVDSYQKASNEYNKLLGDAGDQAVSADVRDQRKQAAESKLRELQQMESDIRDFDVRARTTLGDEEDRWRGKILKEITAIVRTEASHGGYTLVLDTAALSRDLTPVVVYSATTNDDLTDKVLSDLNADAPADLPTDTNTSATNTPSTNSLSATNYDFDLRHFKPPPGATNQLK
jgi:outer membrane protein